MSYARFPEPYYIYPSKDGIMFNTKYLPNDAIDLLLYKLFLKNRREELIERLKRGRRIARTHIKGDIDNLEEIEKTYWEIHLKDLDRNEDELLKNLIKNKWGTI